MCALLTGLDLRLFGTHVLGLGLLIGSTHFGWPSSDDVLVALAKASIVILD
jgi:hypothetical protein